MATEDLVGVGLGSRSRIRGDRMEFDTLDAPWTMVNGYYRRTRGW